MAEDNLHAHFNAATMLTEDELWDELGGFLLLIMNGYCHHRELEPRIEAGAFVELVNIDDLMERKAAGLPPYAPR